MVKPISSPKKTHMRSSKVYKWTEVSQLGKKTSRIKKNTQKRPILETFLCLIIHDQLKHKCFLIKLRQLPKCPHILKETDNFKCRYNNGLFVVADVRCTPSFYIYKPVAIKRENNSPYPQSSLALQWRTANR